MLRASGPSCQVGDVVLAVGNPLGLGQTVTMGISAKGRVTGVGDGSYENFLQTDAPINQGNSGGALVNLSGQLVGINSQIVSSTGGNIGIGFAVPSNMAHHVMDQLVANGEVRRGKLGVSIQTVTAEMAESLELDGVRGAIVGGVEVDSLAAHAGVQRGDVITAFEGISVADSNHLRNLVRQTSPGTDVTLGIMRQGRSIDAQVTLGGLSSGETMASPTAPSPDERLGMSVRPLTPESSARFQVASNTEGLVVVAVDPAGTRDSPGESVLHTRALILWAIWGSWNAARNPAHSDSAVKPTRQVG